MSAFGIGIQAVELGLIPDVITRRAIRRLCAERIRLVREDGPEAMSKFIDSMKTGPVAPVPEKANEQHYEVPPAFFAETLGTHRKYSCCYWPTNNTTLDEAEEAALQVTCERAELADHQHILELGCGWGSLSLYMAEKYPNSKITAVSNSAPQRKHIESAAISRGLNNLRVLTADMNEFTPADFGTSAGTFDRVVSVEMFEHMRNYELLLNRISDWMKPSGKLFLHIFCHRELAYPFETEGASNWMGRYFFTGGIMPSENLLHLFAKDLHVVKQWEWNGKQYQKTSDAWLARLDANRNRVMPILNSAYGSRNSRRWFNRWRMFFLACSELFGCEEGNEWFVSHYLLEQHRDATI